MSSDITESPTSFTVRFNVSFFASEGWVPLAAAMVGTVGKKPMWAGLGLRPVVGTTVDIKISPRPLEHRELVLLLSCWRRWDHGSVSGSAINTWLADVDLAAGPDCEDSPHFKRVDIDCFEAIRLLEESGFGFLPESDLQDLGDSYVSWLATVCIGVFCQVAEYLVLPHYVWAPAGNLSS